jgi:catechol 2,3-dioxygenase-like lactoylglutathione lyase family enzyme
MIRGIKFACVPTRDQDRALKFYTEKLGFRVMTDQPFGAQRWIELGIPGAESQIVLFTPEGHEDRIGGFQPVTFWTDDVFGTAKTLKEKGVEFAAEPKRGTVGDVVDFQGRGWESVCALEQVRGVEQRGHWSRTEFCRLGRRTRASRTTRALGATAVVDVEFESGIRGEDFGDFAQAFGHGSGGQQRVVALAQIVVIDVEIEREQVDGNRIGEAGG